MKLSQSQEKLKKNKMLRSMRTPSKHNEESSQSMKTQLERQYRPTSETKQSKANEIKPSCDSTSRSGTPTLHPDSEKTILQESLSTSKDEKKKRRKQVPIFNKNESSQLGVSNNSDLSLDTQKKTKFNQKPNKLNSSKEGKIGKKMALNWESNKEYKPGMLSEMLQIKKYGRLIVPYDPSFGLDPTYKIPDNTSDNNEETKKLKLNPLFDLSKRSSDMATLSSDVSGSVFVGNLPRDATVGSVKKLFRKCGLIHKVKLKCKQTTRSEKISSSSTDECCYSASKSNKLVTAVIKFKSSESCMSALKLNGKLYKGCHLRVSNTKDDDKLERNKSVFVGNLAYKAEDEDLWQAFEKCGPIESVRLIRDEPSAKGKGFGYVNFKTDDAVEKALKLDGKSILGRDIRVFRGNMHVESKSNSINAKRKKNKKKKKSVNSAGKPLEQITTDGSMVIKVKITKPVVKLQVKRKTNDTEIQENQPSKRLKIPEVEAKKNKKKRKKKQD